MAFLKIFKDFPLTVQILYGIINATLWNENEGAYLP
jgi:hypothetical protein